jgi:hypothetical protein
VLQNPVVHTQCFKCATRCISISLPPSINVSCCRYVWCVNDRGTIVAWSLCASEHLPHLNRTTFQLEFAAISRTRTHHPSRNIENAAGGPIRGHTIITVFPGLSHLSSRSHERIFINAQTYKIPRKRNPSVLCFSSAFQDDTRLCRRHVASDR